MFSKDQRLGSPVREVTRYLILVVRSEKIRVSLKPVLSASNREELLVGYANGVPLQELTAKFKIHRSTVRAIARRAGHPGRDPEHSEELRSEAAGLYAEGLILVQVAGQLGIGDEAVRSAVVVKGGDYPPKRTSSIQRVNRSQEKLFALNNVQVQSFVMHPQTAVVAILPFS